MTDPEAAGLTRRWVGAWMAARGLGATEVLGWPQVRVGAASRETEVVCVDPDEPTWAALVDAVAGDERAMLTVVSARAADYVRALPPGVRVDRADETLMTRTLAPVDPPAPPPGFAVDREVEAGTGRCVVRLVRDGSVAAEGTVGVRDADAAYDAVETLPRHRRQGLGRWVMGTLDAYAAEQGARTGLLVATADGSALYTALGWRTVAPMRSLMGERAATAR